MKVGIIGSGFTPQLAIMLIQKWENHFQIKQKLAEEIDEQHHSLEFRTMLATLDLKRILQDDAITDDEKMKLYSMALSHSRNVDKNAYWLFPILEKLFQMSESAVVSSSKQKTNNPKNKRFQKTRLFGMCLNYIRA